VGRGLGAVGTRLVDQLLVLAVDLRDLGLLELRDRDVLALVESPIDGRGEHAEFHGEGRDERDHEQEDRSADDRPEASLVTRRVVGDDALVDLEDQQGEHRSERQGPEHRAREGVGPQGGPDPEVHDQLDQEDPGEPGEFLAHPLREERVAEHLHPGHVEEPVLAGDAGDLARRRSAHRILSFVAVSPMETGFV